MSTEDGQSGWVSFVSAGGKLLLRCVDPAAVRVAVADAGEELSVDGSAEAGGGDER